MPTAFFTWWTDAWRSRRSTNRSTRSPAAAHPPCPGGRSGGLLEAVQTASPWVCRKTHGVNSPTEELTREHAAFIQRVRYRTGTDVAYRQQLPLLTGA